jgi:vacuolar-type H+-ATPase subunit I/STV1
MERFKRRLVVGSMAGALSTLVMSAFMLTAGRLGWLTEQAPETVTRRSVKLATGSRIGGLRLHALTGVLHLGFGTACGAIYAASWGRSRTTPVAAGLMGALFASVVWFVSYAGFLPGLGLMPAVSDDQRQRPLVMLLAHWIYGGALGLIVAARQDPEQAGREVAWNRMRS